MALLSNNCQDLLKVKQKNTLGMNPYRIQCMNELKSYRTEEELKGYLEDKGIDIRTDNIQWFTETEKAEIVDYWKAHEQEFLSKIRPRWTYYGPVKKVSGKELEEIVEEGGTE